MELSQSEKQRLLAAAKTTVEISSSPLRSAGTETNSTAILASSVAIEAIMAAGVETPSKTTAVVSGSVAAGAKSVTLITSAAFVGTILGDAAVASTTYPFSASQSNTLAAIAYTMSAGAIEIIKVV